VRRLLVLCAVTAVIWGLFAAALRMHQVADVSAASSSGNLVLFEIQSTGGCPLGTGYVFCDQVPGTTSPAEVFYVDSTAAVSGLSVSFAAVKGLSANFAAGDFTIESNSCTGSLAANQQCEIGVAFSPTKTGLREAALTVTDAGGDTLAIVIEGTGKNLAMAPAASSSCTSPDNAFTYCTELVGSASGAEAFTLTAGVLDTGVTISLAAIPGLSSEFAAGDFTVDSTTCTGALAALASCAINVAFTPTTAGLRSAALTATDSNGDTTAVYLAGNTTSGLFNPSIEPGSNTATCARINFYGFCNEPEGGQTASSTFTLQNTSGTQLSGVSVPSASANGNFTVTGTTCVAMLAANASCTISVAFTPKSTGEIQDTVTVTDSAGDIAGYNLAGYGDDFNIQLASGQTTEVNVPQGGTATFMLQVVPDSVFGQNGEQVTFDCPTTLPENTSCAISPCPASITPGTPTAFTVTFVTSTATVQAPRPAPDTPCTGYGPPVPGATSVVRMHEPAGPRAPSARQFPALALWAILGAIMALAAALLCGGQKRSRLRLVFACAGIAAMIFTGCHHGAAVTQATPLGTTTMTIQADALDANGNPLNASRTLPQADELTLDVVTPITPF
jgi:hypothetical protein